MVGLLWHFEGRSFAAPAALTLARFDGSALAPAPVADKPQMVLFVAGNCPCERSALRQFESLQGRYGGRVRLAVAANSGMPRPVLPAGVDVLASSWHAQIPAFPAVAVWDARGVLQYFGPADAGPDCGDRNDYVTRSLDRALAGLSPAIAPADMVGCLCPANSSNR